MLAFHTFTRLSRHLSAHIRVLAAWAMMTVAIVATAWVWRSALLFLYFFAGWSPLGIPLVNLGVTFFLAVAGLVLIAVAQDRCIEWERKSVLGANLARVLGMSLLAIGVGLVIVLR
jgi:hypothetical protein